MTPGHANEVRIVPPGPQDDLHDELELLGRGLPRLLGERHRRE